MKSLSPLSLCLGSLCLLVLLLACDPQSVLGPQARNARPQDLRTRFHSGACYGRCEIFTLELYDTGLLIYKGERFTDRPGVWQQNINRRRAVALIDSLARADFANYPLSFPSQIPDAATTTITYFDETGRPAQTSFKESAPQELELLGRQLRRLASMKGWRQVSADIPDSSILPTRKEAREEIIVHLEANVKAEAWIVAYAKQDVQLLRRIAPNSPYYVITADPNRMPAKELLGFLRQDASVVSAQLNKQVGIR